VRVSNMELHRERACRRAHHDWILGRICDPGRHGALPGSAWAQWYTEEYERHRSQDEPHPGRGGGHE